MSPVEIAMIIVALISAASAYASAKSSNKASMINNQTNADVEKEKTRTDLETEAYNRARAYDVATIARQDAEILELRTEREQLKTTVKRLEDRVAVLEREHQHCNL